MIVGMIASIAVGMIASIAVGMTMPVPIPVSGPTTSPLASRRVIVFSHGHYSMTLWLLMTTY
ncbi:hypothetical protein CAQUA_06605 [Corynebacterium aquatimens]|nr:hypothetical protein CAQUA_06605 [Corynebacterium aquatimens]